MKVLDLPPVWLISLMVLVWLISVILPGLNLHWASQSTVSLVFLVAGLALMFVAAFQMVLARTTIIPRRNPAALVRSGVFRLSRNPIYLGDALILAATVAKYGTWLALPLIPVFVWLITTRFIKGEEQRLLDGFGDEFTEWRRTTRRWI